MSMLMSPSFDELQLTDEELETLETQGYGTEEAILQAVTPNLIGPVWAVDDEGNWLLPEKTLGWQIAAWCADFLTAFKGGPWKFTLEQLRFILWWYAVDDNGDFIYRTGVLQRLKGWGKDPLLAVICLVEFAGPSRVVGWDKDGNPIGGPADSPVVQISAVNQKQTTNTMDLIPGLMSDRFLSVYSVKPGAEKIRGRVGGKLAQIVAVTSSPLALEGKRTTFSLLNETHNWLVANKGHAMFEVIDGNAAKMNARYLAITNAHLPGQDSIAERMRDEYDRQQEEGVVSDGDFLYDSVEAHHTAPLGGPLLPRIVERIRGDAIWLNVESVLSSIRRKTVSVERSRRMWLNQVWAGSDGLHDPLTWDGLSDAYLSGLRDEHGPHAGLRDGDDVVIGFDGSKREDATAIVLIRVRDAAVFLYGLWEAPQVVRTKADEEWEVNREAVDSAIHEAFRRFNVVAFYADVAQWETYIDKWTTSFGDKLKVNARDGKPIAWDMRGSLKASTLAHERLMNAIWDGAIKHNGDRRLRRHVLNAHRRENNHGVSFGKESRASRRKVDAYAALMLAHEALVTYRQKAASSPRKMGKRSGRGYFF